MSLSIIGLPECRCRIDIFFAPGWAPALQAPTLSGTASDSSPELKRFLFEQH
jgi:hypothetical protein